MSCNCNHCLRHQRFMDVISRVKNDQDKNFLDSLMDALVNAEDNRDYFKAIVQNKWPDSAEILASFRG